MKKLLLLLCALLLSCASDGMTEYPYPEEGGKLQQPISTSGTGGYVHGVCDTRKREKCSYVTGCPGTARCVVPATKHLKVAMLGDDFEFSGESWKYEIRRLLGPSTWASGDIAKITGWSSEETSEANANLIVQRSFCSCVTAACDTMADLLCFQEPVGPAAQVLLETTPGGGTSMPGVYVRPGSATVKRYMFINVDRMEELRSLNAMFGNDYHFVVEHTVRWGIWSMLGNGAYGTGQAEAYPSAWSPYQVMRKELWNPLTQYNYNNFPEEWEKCMMRDYTLTNMNTYSLFPVGCGANGEH